MTTAPERWGPLGFRVIGAMKLASAVMLAAAGFGIFRMINGDVGASLDHLISRLHLDPDNHLIHEGVARIAVLNKTNLKVIGAGTFFYALLHLVEGTGLILLKPWAEYLTVIATGSLLPLELVEVARKPTLIRVGILAINLAILIYVVVQIRRDHKSRTRVEVTPTQ